MPPLHPSTPAFTGAGPALNESASCGPCDALMLSDVEARALAPRRSGGGHDVRQGYGVWGQRCVLPSWRHPRREASGDPSLNGMAEASWKDVRMRHLREMAPIWLCHRGDDVMACGKQKPGACAWAAYAEIAVRFLIATPHHDTHTRWRGTIG